jgi:general secretion pathway protein H
MPTSTAAPWSERGRRRDAGFTLIELGLVLLIISVTLVLVVPRFRDQSHAELISQTRKLAATFRFLQQEAILNGRVYRLNFDLDQQRYSVTAADASDPDAGFVQESGSLMQDVALPSTVQISDVNVPLSGGKVYEGIGWVQFYPDGYVDPSVVHLDNGQEVYTLYVDQPLTGRANVQSGYLDLGNRG